MIKKEKTFKRLLIGLLCLTALCLQAQNNNTLSAQLSQAIKEKKAEIGIAIIIDGKDTITLNNSDKYPMMSVFKFHQALAMANYMHQNQLPLDTQIFITAADLKPNTYSPLRDKYPNGGIYLSIADLLKYTLQQSDNNACDILFQYQGGTKATDHYIRSLEIGPCAITATEDEMHQELNRCYENRTSPLAAAQLVEIFLKQPLFAKPYKEFIYQTMVECETGKDRLVAPLLGKGAVIGHKTGTGDRNAKGEQIGCNDIGFVFLPNGHAYSIAVFVKDAQESNSANSQIIAEISRIVYEYIVKEYIN